MPLEKLLQALWTNSNWKAEKAAESTEITSAWEHRGKCEWCQGRGLSHPKGNFSRRLVASELRLHRALIENSLSPMRAPNHSSHQMRLSGWKQELSKLRRYPNLNCCAWLLGRGASIEGNNFEGLRQLFFIAGTNTSSKIPAVNGETRDFHPESFDTGVQGDRKNGRL